MSGSNFKTWLLLATSRPVVVRAFACGAIVGSILIAINHCNCILGGNFGMECLAKSALMPVVPYIVSTVSSVHALTQAEQRTEDAR